MFADGLLPVWSWLVLAGVGIVVIFKVALAVAGRRAQRRLEARLKQEIEQTQQRRAAAAERRRSAEEACGLWCCWQNTKTAGAVYKLERHNVAREDKELECQQRPGYYGGVDGSVAVPGLFWLAQTAEHGGETTAHYPLHGCAACEELMDAHIEEVTHDYLGRVQAFSDIGYESRDGHIHTHTYQPAGHR